MAGVKRRTKYRKQVQADVLDEVHAPEEGEVIVRIVRSHGSNILEVEEEDGSTGKCILPTKYRKLIWVKRGDFLIVSRATGDYDTAASDKGGSVRFMVEHILTAASIKVLRKEGAWPAAFAPPPEAGEGGGGEEEEAPATRGSSGAVGGGAAASGAGAASDEEGGSEDDMAGVFVNRNRRRVYVDSEEEDSTDSDEE